MGRAFLYGNGGSGGTLTVTAPAGVTVTVSKDGKTKTKTADSSGIAVFKGLGSGVWTVTITGDGKTAQKTVAITTDYSTAISFNTIPEFTYTGDFEIVSDDDQPITVSQDNWKIRFLTSGTLTFTSLNGAEDVIDVFLVGGGAGGINNKTAYLSGPGGGGGKTVTSKNVSIEIGKEYSIVVGAGGLPNGNGGSTSAFGETAIGGSGKHGGSGGGSLTHNGYSDGAGYDTVSTNDLYPGTGQGTTTREFSEADGTLYSAGGGAGYYWNNTTQLTYPGDDSGGTGAGLNTDATPGKTNRGGGGGGGRNNSGNGAAAGGSGIVIIRNAREAA